MNMWTDFCRGCLAIASKISILDSDKDLKQKFFEVTSIEVTLDDKLPQHLCDNCYNSMKSAHEFRTQCLEMNEELKLQLNNFLMHHAKNVEKSIPDNEMSDNTINVDKYPDDPVKQLEELMKSELDDGDDDCYYVLVVDPKDQVENENPNVEKVQTNASEPNLKLEIQDEVNIKKEPFESSIESFIITDKIPANVPATILENEEESQDYYYDNNMDMGNHDVDMDNQYSTSQELSTEHSSQNAKTFKIENADDNILKTIASDIIQTSPKSLNNYVKILTSTRPDGTIVLKSSDKITYLTDTELITNNDDEDPMTQEVILCEGDDSSPLQILQCDGNELVIEFAGDSQIATVLQQEDGSFLCDCGESFEEFSEYENHQATHNPAGDYLCNLCGKGFESSEILVGHQLLHNVTGTLVVCPYCGHSVKRSSLTQHMKIHHSSVKPKCVICMKQFATSNNLKRHMMIHSGIKEFECDICSKRFHQKVTMQTHRLTHINPLACNECDQAFTTSTDLQLHKESNQCTKSKIVKVKEGLLKSAKEEVTSAGNVIGFSCSLCKKMFSVESALEQHIENMHMVDPAELLCSECGDILPSKKDMQEHIQSHKIMKSKNLKRFECGTCGKGCSSKAMLLMHERVHTDERPFACQLCLLKFKTKTHLRTHQLTHTKEKPYGCSVCMKFFALKGNLVVHLRTHTGERPYVCSLCGEAFIDSKYLKKHKLRKHAIENVPWNEY